MKGRWVIKSKLGHGYSLPPARNMPSVRGEIEHAYTHNIEEAMTFRSPESMAGHINPETETAEWING